MIWRCQSELFVDASRSFAREREQTACASVDTMASGAKQWFYKVRERRRRTSHVRADGTFTETEAWNEGVPSQVKTPNATKATWFGGWTYHRTNVVKRSWRRTHATMRRNRMKQKCRERNQHGRGTSNRRRHSREYQQRRRGGHRTDGNDKTRSSDSRKTIGTTAGLTERDPHDAKRKDDARRAHHHVVLLRGWCRYEAQRPYLARHRRTKTRYIGI